jgi:hypothetical protein
VADLHVSFYHYYYIIYSDPPPDQGGGREGGRDGWGGDGETTPSGLTDADFDSNWDESTETFDAMELPEELLRGIYSYGFEKPSAIQQRAIKPTMLGRDLIAQAQSGTVSPQVVFFGSQQTHMHTRDDDFI